jgi:hypothetical protein
MYGFPPLKYEAKNVSNEIKDITKQRSFSDNTQKFINIRQILNSKKDKIISNVNNKPQLDIVTDV